MQKLYFISILLPGPLEERIMQLKTEIARRFQSVAALKPLGRITIQENFLFDDRHLESLTSRLDNVFSETRPFDVQLQDFGAFPAHTIFAAVRDFFPFQRLRQRLYQQLSQEKNFPAPALGRPAMTPHVTLACRDLTPDKFDEAWAEFSQRELSDSFTAASAHLMEHRGKWRPVREFPFLGLPQASRLQQELFCA